MKRILALALVAFIALAALVSCGGSESGESGSNTIIGKWQKIDSEYGKSENVYEFKSDGTIEYTSYSSGGITYQGTYSINGDTLSFTIDYHYTTASYYGKFKLEDDRLYLYDNDADPDEYKPLNTNYTSAIFTRVN